MLPVRLPENIDLNVKGNPLDAQKDWKNIIIDGKNLSEKPTPWIHLFAHPGII